MGSNISGGVSARFVGGGMMTKPIAIDFFTGAGGAALGLKRAGFYVVGIDIKKPSAYYGDVVYPSGLM